MRTIDKGIPHAMQLVFPVFQTIGANSYIGAYTEIQDQAKKENRRRNLRISGRLRRRPIIPATVATLMS